MSGHLQTRLVASLSVWPRAEASFRLLGRESSLHGRMHRERGRESLFGVPFFSKPSFSAAKAQQSDSRSDEPSFASASGDVEEVEAVTSHVWLGI